MSQKVAGSMLARPAGAPVSTVACPPGTLAGGPTRTRFFDGMFLTQADLENEQRYWRIKRRLTNRALGDGVVWGLGVEWNPRRRSFRLAPGYALDCCGNDLVVECPVEISEQELWARADASLRSGESAQMSPAGGGGTPAGSSAANPAAEANAARPLRACLVLSYVECPEEARPVHRDACAGPAGYCEPSRIRESTRLLLVAPPKRPPPTPPELFVLELEKWRDSLPADVRAQLFPDPGAPPPIPGTGAVPLELRVSVPGAPPQAASVPIPAAGSVGPISPLQAQQVVSGPGTGVVTFELHAGTGWSLMAGRVSDRGRAVETVTPPAAPSMYWALDLALPEPGGMATTPFEFTLDDLELGQTFDPARRGRVRGVVRGSVMVTQTAAAVNVRVEGLTVAIEHADVFESAESERCLRELLPWGWASDPANGSKTARVLVLAALYAFLSEAVRGSSSGVVREVARVVYTVTWYALFGVNASAPVDESYRQKLVEHILALYRRWCHGFMYPGPRCGDDHHGVYLGSVELSRSGGVASFDAWENRRSVLTGPLMNHWAAQLGFAPLDVIGARFARALCCLGGLPPLLTEASAGGQFPWIGSASDLAGNSLHMGTTGSVTDFAGAHNAPVQWLGMNAIVSRLLEAFTARGDAGAKEVLAVALPAGGSLAIAVPRAEVEASSSRIRADVLALTRRGKYYVREGGREAVFDFTSAVLRAAPADAMVDERTPAATRKLAEAVAQRGVTLADVAEHGTEATLRRAGLGDDAETREAAADLVDGAEQLVDKVAQATVNVLGPKLDRSSFGVSERQQKLAASIARELIPELPPEQVLRAARQTATVRGASG